MKKKKKTNWKLLEKQAKEVCNNLRIVNAWLLHRLKENSNIIYLFQQDIKKFKIKAQHGRNKRKR